MALDSKLTQNINLRANGDQLLLPLKAFGREINKVIKDLHTLTDSFSKGNHKSENQLRAQVQLLQRMIGEASTLQNILTSSKNRGLLDQLSEQKLGRSAATASRLSQELGRTRSAADALDVRLGQLNKKFADLNEAGRRVGQRDLSKALNTQEAIRQVTRLEQQIRALDARGKATGGFSAEAAKVRADLQRAQDTLLQRVQNPRRSNFSVEIAQVQELVRAFNQVTRAEEQAAAAADRLRTKLRQSTLNRVNQTDPMLLSSLNRGAAAYRFTNDQARSFNLPALGREIDVNMAKLVRLREVMSRALSPSTNASEASIARLNRLWEGLTSRISEAMAKQKAFDALPENKRGKLLQQFFGSFESLKSTAGIVAGFTLVNAAIGAVMSGLSSGVQFIRQWEDELAKLQAIAGATDIEMRHMAKSILEVAANSRYSTIEITQAATQIAQAGFSAQETSKVLKDALTLAASSGSSPTEAVDTLTSALGAFQLQASESTHIVDTLVSGLNRSKLTIQQMQAALQYAGATAHEAGISFDELVAVASSAANAGIRSGSTIGTGLRQLIVDLQTPTKDFRQELESLGLTMADVDVKTKGFAGVVKTLTEAGFSAEQAYASFETRAASFFLAFRGQIGLYDDLSLSLAQVGAASEANERAMDSLSAKLTKLMNVLGGVVALLATPFVNSLKLIVDTVSGLLGFIQHLAIKLGALGESSAFAEAALSAIAVAIAGFAVGGPLGAAIGGILGLTGALYGAADASEQLEAKTNQAKAEMDSSVDTVNAAQEAITNLITKQDTLKKNQVALQVETLNLAGKFKELSTYLAGTAQGYDDVLEAMIRVRGEAARDAATKAEATGLAARAEFNNQLGALDTNTRSLRLETKRRSSQTVGGATGSVVAALNGSTGANYASMSGAQLNSTAIDLQAQINQLNREKDTNTTAARLLPILEERLDIVRKLAAKKGEIDIANRTVGIYNAQQSDAAQTRYRQGLLVREKVDSGLTANQNQPGTGDAILGDIVGKAKRRISAMKDELGRLDPKSNDAAVLQSDITELEAQVARVKRASDTAGRGLMKEERAGAGENLTGTQVATLLRKEFKGANPTSYGKRPYAKQVELWNNYKAGRGPEAARPGRSAHGSDHAIDLAPIPGVDIDQIAAFLESRGLELTDRRVERNPKTGASHWHFAWKPKTSQFGKKEDSAKETAAKELQQLLEQGANTRVSAAEATITKLTKQAQNGSVPVGDLTAQFSAAQDEYRAARLNAFDIANPTAGLSDTMKKVVANNRAALEGEIAEKAAAFFANFYRFIADSAANVLDAAYAAAESQYNDAKFAAEAPVRAAAHNSATLNNNVNKGRFGVGAEHRQKRETFQAQLGADQSTAVALNAQVATQQAALNTYDKQISGLNPLSEEGIAAIKKRDDAQQKLNETMREAAELQASINDRTQDFASIPLATRLRESVAAWAENSGAMDSWGKMLENNIGPALDMFTDQLATMFTNIASGTRTVVQALGDFIKAFAKFVLQIIAKALALMAVKAILKAFGLELQSSPGGTVIGKTAGKFGGGLVDRKKDYPGLFGGGRVNRGVPNRDSALYNLAEGEYVVRNQSVRELGIPFMDQINKHGAKGLAKMGGVGKQFTNIQAPQQTTNVYVVQEKSKPQLGPTDVLVTIQEDIVAGGVTKKLIKQVASGA